MKRILRAILPALGLVIGLASAPSAKAQANFYAPLAIASNTQSDHFAAFDFTIYVQFDYYATGGNGSSSTYFSTYSDSAVHTLAPWGQVGDWYDYRSDIYAKALAVAQYEANLAGHGYVYSLDNFYYTYDSAAYNYAYREAATAPTAASASIPYGSTWEPTLVGGSGGTPMWCAAGANAWQTGTFNFFVTPGVYDLYVAVKSDPGYDGNVTDPIQGRMMVRVVPYTLTVY